jgi:hypothetical protein
LGTGRVQVVTPGGTFYVGSGSSGDASAIIASCESSYLTNAQAAYDTFVSEITAVISEAKGLITSTEDRDNVFYTDLGSSVDLKFTNAKNKATRALRDSQTVFGKCLSDGIKVLDSNIDTLVSDAIDTINDKYDELIDAINEFYDDYYSSVDDEDDIESWTELYNDSMADTNESVFDEALNRYKDLLLAARTTLESDIAIAINTYNLTLDHAYGYADSYFSNNDIDKVTRVAVTESLSDMTDIIKPVVNRMITDAVNTYQRTAQVAQTAANTSISDANTDLNDYLRDHSVTIDPAYSQSSLEFTDRVSDYTSEFMSDITKKISTYSTTISDKMTDINDQISDRMESFITDRPVIDDVSTLQVPDQIITDDNNTFSLEVKNNGTKAWDGGLGIKLVDEYKKSIENITPDNIIHLEPGQSATLSCTIYVPKKVPPKNYNIGKTLTITRYIITRS